jgi:hypothetical protein
MLLTIAACTPNTSEPLPTSVQIPSAEPTRVVEVVGTLAPRATLPATFTPTSTLTAEPSATITDTITFTPSATITETATTTGTPEPTLPPEARPLTSLLQVALQTTILPSDFQVPDFQGIDVPLTTPTPDQPGGGVLIVETSVSAPPFGISIPNNCAFYPPAGFGVVYANNVDIATQLGCPLGNPPDMLSLNAVFQPYQTGQMLWLDGEIYVLYNNNTFTSYTDNFVSGVDPELNPEAPPAGFIAPVRGFNKVWTNNPSVRTGLGWATALESGIQARAVNFQSGLMVFLPGRSDVFVFIGSNPDGRWRSVPGGA